MASMVMTFAGGAAIAAATKPALSSRRGIIVAKASAGSEGDQKVSFQMRKSKEEGNNGRRDLMLAVAAAAACSVAKIALADEPKNGTEEAKKKYAPICATMPTARICHK